MQSPLAVSLPSNGGSWEPRQTTICASPLCSASAVAILRGEPEPEPEPCCSLCAPALSKQTASAAHEDQLWYRNLLMFKWEFMRIERGIAPLCCLVILVAGCAAYKQAELASSPQCPDKAASPPERGLICPAVPDEQRRETLAHPDAARIETRWQAAQAALRPRLLLRLAEDFVRDFPRSEYAQPAQVLILGARQALEAQRAAELSSDALQDAGGDAAYGGDLRTALRGDKDSAYRIALMYRHGTNGLDKALRRAEQWLRFAAELGNATASWEVAQIYSGRGQQGEAAHYEHRAVELGFRPPPRLSNRGY